LTEELLNEFVEEIAELKLVPSSGGRFEVTVDGEPVFSKKQLGRHAEPGEIARNLRALLARRAAE
jgi:selenoprotein W-related protein